MKPSIGRVVIFRMADIAPPINGSREHPAMITAVHSETSVNLKVLCDGPQTPWVTSVEFSENDTGKGSSCFFPPRV